LLDWLKDKSIAALARAETAARREDAEEQRRKYAEANGTASDAPKRDEEFEKVIEEHRQPIELPGIELASGSRFALLVIERTSEGLCRVAQVTAEPK
jgi:hypothetical protein